MGIKDSYLIEKPEKGLFITITMTGETGKELEGQLEMQKHSIELRKSQKPIVQ